MLTGAEEINWVCVFFKKPMAFYQLEVHYAWLERC